MSRAATSIGKECTVAEECLFCRIASGDIPSEKVYEDGEMVAFRDIHPVAPTHILVVPKVHIASVEGLSDADEGLIGRMVLRAKALASVEGVSESGYRLVMNCGPDGGQVIHHLHLHLVGGRPLGNRLG